MKVCVTYLARGVISRPLVPRYDPVFALCESRMGIDSLASYDFAIFPIPRCPSMIWSVYPNIDRQSSILSLGSSSN
jgi:hypothetical protein